MLALSDGIPQTMSLKTILEKFIEHRSVVVRRRSLFELAKAKARELSLRVSRGAGPYR